MSRRVALVLIVWNEEQGLKTILPVIPFDKFDEILAVDGHSIDQTAGLLRQAGIRVHTQRQPGLGAAMLEARGLITSDALVFFHPDGNEAPNDLPRLAALLREGKAFVVASRMIDGAWNEDDYKFVKLRKWANVGFAALANLCFARHGNRTTDVTNGLRGISCAAFDQMQLTSTDLTLDFQMVIRALKRGIPITEFPTREGARISGQTKFANLSTGIAELRLLIHELFEGRRVA
jgi:glycosyltransferase involved in cell wall biosynthesis